MRKTLFILSIAILSNTLGAQAPGVLPFGYLQGYDFSTEPIKKVPTKMRALQPFDENSAEFSNCLWNCDGSLRYFSSRYCVFNGITGDTLKNGYYYNIGNCVGYNCQGSNQNNYFIPKPGSNDTVYFFYAAVVPTLKPLKLVYAIIDNRSNGGKGEVVKKNVVLQNKHNHFHYTKHSNGRWWWLVTAWNEDSAAAYLISDTGICHTPVFSKCVSNIYKLNVYSPQTEFIGGAFRFSHNGKYLVSTGIDENVNPSGNVLLYEFNKSTGILSNPKALFKMIQFPHSEMQTHTAEFSPNDSFVFVSSNSYSSQKRVPYLFQINIFTKQVYRHIIGQPIEFSLGSTRTLITAPNNTIFGLFGLSDKPFVNIKYPNKWGAAAKIVQWNDSNAHYIYQFPEPIYTYKNANWESNLTYNPCADSARFTYTGDTSFAWLKWKFGDGDSVVFYPPLKPSFTFWHKYKGTGKYYVRMQARHHSCNGNNWFGDTLEMRFNPGLFYKTKPSVIPFCDSSKLLWQDSLVNTQSWYLNSMPFGSNDSGNWNVGSGLLTNLGAKTIYKTAYKTAPVRLSLYAPNGCIKNYVDTFNTLLLDKPVAQISLENTSCVGSLFYVKDTFAKTTDTLYWKYNNNSTVIVGATSAKFQSILAKDTVFLKISSENGCTSDTFRTIEVLKRPNAQYNVIDSICQFDSINAVANLQAPADTAFWFLNSELKSTLFFPNNKFNAAATMFGSIPLSLIIKSANGCADSQSSAVKIFQSPSANFTITDTLCTNKSIKLWSLNNLINQSLLWRNNNIEIGNDSIQYYKTNKIGINKIDLIIENENGCVDSASRIFYALKGPIAAILSNDTGFCQGSAIAINHQKDTGSTIWSFNGWKQNADVFYLPGTATGNSNGTWPIYLIKSLTNGCSDTTSIQLTIFKKPIPNIRYTAPICQNDTVNFEQTVQAQKTEWFIDNQNYVGNNVSHIFNINGARPMSCSITSNEGCVGQIVQNLNVLPAPKVKIGITGSDYDPSKGYGWYFGALPDTFSDYSWVIGKSGFSSQSYPKVYFPTVGDTQLIKLTVSDAAGCTAIADTLLVIKGLTMYLFPNSFTPNFDDLNDGFGITGPEYVKNYKLWIFNRWGENVFYTENPYEQWLPINPIPGLYVYKAKIQDIYSRWEELNGTVLLIK